MSCFETSANLVSESEEEFNSVEESSLMMQNQIKEGKDRAWEEYWCKGALSLGIEESPRLEVGIWIEGGWVLVSVDFGIVSLVLRVGLNSVCVILKCFE